LVCNTVTIGRFPRKPPGFSLEFSLGEYLEEVALRQTASLRRGMK
jgi:hypothetical protein